MAERSFLQRVFIQKKSPRLRVSWRLALFFLLLMLMMWLFSPLSGLLGGGMLAAEATAALSATLTIWILRRWVDKAPFSALGLQLDSHTVPDLLAGFMITFFLMGFIFLAEWALGWLHPLGFAWQVSAPVTVLSAALGAFLLFVLVAWVEELISRGYLLQTLADGMPRTWAIVISSAFFGLAHLGNPNATWTAALGIFLAGLFLAYPWARTERLWLSIGLHLGWNFFEGVVFGFPVSGLDIPRLTLIQVHGPQIWTGGAFGPEAGLIVVPALALGAALIYFYTQNER